MRASYRENARATGQALGGPAARHLLLEPVVPPAPVGAFAASEKADSVVYQIQSALPGMPRRRGLVRALFGCSVVAALVNGCVSQMTCESPVDPCVESGGPAEAAVTAAAAGALWVGGGGCAIAGCRPPFVCNTGSGLCEHMACGAGRGTCPPGPSCDAMTSTGR